MDLIHGLGHGGDVVLGRAGGGVVVDLVCHFSIFDNFLILVGEFGFLLAWYVFFYRRGYCIGYWV